MNIQLPPGSFANERIKLVRNVVFAAEFLEKTELN
jgi:hypothetical protein